MIAIDTNLLVYTHRPEMPFHERARHVLTDAVAGTEPVSVPWSCAHEFLAVVSNPWIFKDPAPMNLALDAVRRLLASLSVGFLAEVEAYVKRHGVKKAYLIEAALQHHLQALREIPED